MRITSIADENYKGIFVVTGCSHLAMQSILGATSKLGRLYGIADGFHDFHDFKIFDGLSAIYPCHCTMYKREIRDLFRDKSFECGVGLVIDLEHDYRYDFARKNKGGLK
ncbi:MAG: hypothetical protein JW732_00755 [Dehalococcoidia bacterium]|nr:hypothetical protein [Dehalococcoidia bacterium]